LKKKIGLLGSITIVVANMIGVGIFTSLGFQLLDLTDYRVILLMWGIGGFLALSGTFCYSELSAAYPRSGGEYHFLNISLGKLTGFLSAWTSMLVGFAAPIAAAAHAFSKYYNASLQTDINPLIIGVLVIIIISIIQSINLSVGTKFQIYFTIGKVILIVIFICAGFWVINTSQFFMETNYLETGDFKTQLLSSGFWIGSIYVSYAYSGWNATSYIIDDIEKPEKNVVRSTVFGTLLVTVFYCLLTFIFLRSSPSAEMVGKEEIGYIAASNLFGNYFGIIISAFIAFFLISAISAMTIVGPRVLKRVANDYNIKLLNNPKNNNGTPRLAILFQTIISVIILLTSSFEFIITSMGFLLSIFTTLTALSVILLRYKDPSVKRPWKVPLYPITPILYCLFNFWIIYYIIINKPESALTGGLFLLFGVIFYYLIRIGKKKL